VVSIKPAETGGSSVYVGVRTEPGRVTYSYLPLENLIARAYGIRVGGRISGGPNWVREDRFDVIATFPANAAITRIPAMLQTMLAERFKLAVHWESRVVPVYGLVVAGSGLKVKTSDPSDTPKDTIGVGRIDWRQATVARLIDYIQNDIGERPIVDMTGLSGRYNFRMNWTPARILMENPDAAGPSIFTAIQEQLGLKLENRKAPVQYLVIDHVERPSSN
jgi:uncharacterized protein (TIGR03435 family)